jgi:hypothetical protein
MGAEITPPGDNDRPAPMTRTYVGVLVVEVVVLVGLWAFGAYFGS